MRISVIIPTLNAGPYLEKLLPALMSQDTEAEEIIIIDSSSRDETLDIAGRFRVKTMSIPASSFSHGGTRNIATAEAKGDVLVFMTQDAMPLDGKLLGHLTGPLGTPDIAAAFGRHVPRPDASALEKYARGFNYPDAGSTKGIDDLRKYGVKTFFFSNVCSAIKKEAFVKAGMFPEGVRANEDMLIAINLLLNNYRVAYVPEAAVMHSHNLSLLKQFLRYYNIGSSLRNYRWILKDARPQDEGMRLVREQMSFLIRNQKSNLIPYFLLESIAKYAGFRIGLIAG